MSIQLNRKALIAALKGRGLTSFQDYEDEELCAAIADLIGGAWFEDAVVEALVETAKQDTAEGDEAGCVRCKDDRGPLALVASGARWCQHCRDEWATMSIDDRVHEWHRHPTSGKGTMLHEYLGMSWEGYAQWAAERLGTDDKTEGPAPEAAPEANPWPYIHAMLIRLDNLEHRMKFHVHGDETASRDLDGVWLSKLSEETDNG